MTLLDLPLSDATLGHGRTHCWHGELGQRISARRGVYLYSKKVIHPGVLSSEVGDVRLERIRASWEAMGGTDELEVKG